ncbi:hypothetical protein Ahy_A02g008442 [Arachis hypogaea]|uniref:Putative plant transposon protein domain-containing protein n=1 Tax=Arachis hypogaea TaxID=3818 RepID=A0A445EF49_ARAHY|nr:hypothetical protein Ahy_A02g008442 [Arachis hypogaea]
MTDKGKDIATTSKKRKHSTPSIPSIYKNYAKNPLNDEEKENQLLPSTDPTRDLGDINISWVKEFYCNFFRPTLDSVQLRGREIMITETAIEEALQCRHIPDGTCAHRQAELAIHSMTFNYEALRRMIGLPDTTWVMDANNTKPKGLLFAQLTREAKTWQMIFAHYVLPTTHFSEIPMEMLLLIRCVMEGKDVYFPRLIRQCMWRAHIHGLLPFPTLVTSMAALAEVPWLDDDVIPPPPDADDREVTIPWGGWVHEKPPARRRSSARAVVGTVGPSAPTAAPSSSTAAAPSSSTVPPAAPEPTYLLVQHLFWFLERERLHVRCRLDRMDQALISLGAELPPLPDSPASDEQDHQEEDAEAPTQQDAPPDAPDTTETPQTMRSQSHSQSQSLPLYLPLILRFSIEDDA